MRSTKGLRPVFCNSGGERGVVLITALLVMVFLLPLGIIFLKVAFTENTIASNEVNVASAFGMAEAGLELARRQVNVSPDWQSAFNDLNLPGLTKEYSTAINTADANVADWSTTVPSPLSDATRIRWTGLTLAGGTYTVIGASVDENGTDLTAGQARVLSSGYPPNSTEAMRTIEALLLEPVPTADFLNYGFSSTGAIESDQITFASQPGGRNDSYNGGPAVFKPSLSTGYYSGGNVPTGPGGTPYPGTSTVSVSTTPSYPPIDFAAYASSPTVVNLNALKDANGVVSLTSSAQISPNTAYYVDGSFFIGDIGLNPNVSFIATHDIKNNGTQGMTALSGYPLLLAGGYIYMDTDNTTPLTGAIYSDGSYALAADRDYPINSDWVGHGGTDLIYVESGSQIIGSVGARIPEGSGLRLFGGGGSTITYDMNLLNGLTDLYVGQTGSPPPSGGGKFLSWREK